MSQILVPLHFDNRAIGGTLIPNSGFVKSQNFEPNQDIRKGIFGYNFDNDLDTETIISLPKGSFAVITVTDGIIPLDFPLNAVKFEAGYVTFSGSLSDCLARVNESV